MTADLIVDRISSICASAPFQFVEAVSWASFDMQPTTNVDQVFRIPPPTSQLVRGRFYFVEDRTDALQIWLARKHNQDYDAVRRSLLQDMHALTSAIVRDSCEVSGDYYVGDEGRSHVIADDPSKEYVVLRLTLPILYEAQL